MQAALCATDEDLQQRGRQGAAAQRLTTLSSRIAMSAMVSIISRLAFLAARCSSERNCSSRSQLGRRPLPPSMALLAPQLPQQPTRAPRRK